MGMDAEHGTPSPETAPADGAGADCRPSPGPVTPPDNPRPVLVKEDGLTRTAPDGAGVFAAQSYTDDAGDPLTRAVSVVMRHIHETDSGHYSIVQIDTPQEASNLLHDVLHDAVEIWEIPLPGLPAFLASDASGRCELPDNVTLSIEFNHKAEHAKRQLSELGYRDDHDSEWARKFLAITGGLDDVEYGASLPDDPAPPLESETRFLSPAVGLHAVDLAYLAACNRHVKPGGIEKAERKAEKAIRKTLHKIRRRGEPVWPDDHQRAINMWKSEIVGEMAKAA